MLSRKSKSWTPEILEQIMLAAANGETGGLAEPTLKIVALAAGLGMPKPAGLSFQTGQASFEWASENGRTLSLWLQADGKIRFQSGADGKDGELVEDAPAAFVTHIFHAWTAVR